MSPKTCKTTVVLALWVLSLILLYLTLDKNLAWHIGLCFDVIAAWSLLNIWYVPRY